MDTQFDFADGAGPVAAHRHPHGGGWVADTATVAANCYVGLRARVYGTARVYGNAQVYENAQVYGDARVYENAQVYGDARVYAVLLFAQRSDGWAISAVSTAAGLRIIAGCHYFTPAAAREHWMRTRGGTQLGDESLAIVDFLVRMAVITRLT